jgi:hypothetical protein
MYSEKRFCLYFRNIWYCVLHSATAVNRLSSHLCVELRYLTILLCGDNLNNCSVITRVEVCEHVSVISAQLLS